MFPNALTPNFLHSPSAHQTTTPHQHETSRERPKSAPYLRLKKTRKPLFLQLETTKALKKLKIEKKNSEFFFEFFFEVSGKSHSAEKCKRGRFSSHVRRFGCVDNEVLSTYGKSW